MDVVGFVFADGIYCVRCIGDDADDEEAFALFDHNETDSPDHCGECGDVIRTSLTKRGFEQLKKEYLEGRWRNKELLRQYIEQYDYFDWHFIPTHYGWLDPLGDIKDID